MSVMNVEETAAASTESDEANGTNTSNYSQQDKFNDVVMANDLVSTTTANEYIDKDRYALPELTKGGKENIKR